MNRLRVFSVTIKRFQSCSTPSNKLEKNRHTSTTRTDKRLTNLGNRTTRANRKCRSERMRIRFAAVFVYGQNFICMEIAHKQTNRQWSSTSGHGARASYQTMFPRFRPNDLFCESSCKI